MREGRIIAIPFFLSIFGADGQSCLVQIRLKSRMLVGM